MRERFGGSGAAALVGSAFIYSFFGILTRIIGFSIPVFYGMFVRDLISGGILIVLLLAIKKWHRMGRQDFPWFIVRSAAGILGFYGSYIAFVYLPIGTAYFIFYAGVTIGGYALGSLLFHERLTLLKGLSLVMAILGLMLIYSFNPATGKAGYMLLSLAAGFGTAIWGVFSRKISGIYTDTQLNAVDFLFTGLVALCVTLAMQEPWVPVAPNTIWLANVLFMVMFLSTGQLMVYGFRHISAQIGSLIMLLEVVFGVFWGAVVYKEVLSAATMLGGILILGAIALPEFLARRSSA